MRGAAALVSLAALVVLAALVGGCCKEGREGPPAGPPPTPSSIAPEAPPQAAGPKAPSDPRAHVEALAQVPADMGIVVTLSLDDLVTSLGQPLGGDAAATAKLKAALSTAFLESLGVDPLAAGHAIVGVAVEHQAICMVIPGVAGAGPLKGEPIGDTGLVRLPEGAVAGLHGQTLVLGNEKGAAAALAVARGEAKGLAGTPLGDRHAALAGHLGGGMLVVTFVSPVLRSLWTAAGLPGGGGDAAGLAVSSTLGLVAVVQGDAASLEAIAKEFDAMLGQLRGELDKARGELSQREGVAPRLGIAFVDFFAEGLPNHVQLERAGDALVARTNALEAVGGALPVVGVLASVAVPAFIKYMRRSKTTEAIAQIERIRRGAIHYFSTPKVTATGEKVPCSLPPSVGPTPDGSPCDHPGEQYPANAPGWDDPTWKSLGVGMDGPHRYRYQFESNGLTGADAAFTISAYGDLDCDGIWSTFQRTGHGTPGSADGDCEIERAPGLFIDNEVE